MWFFLPTHAAEPPVVVAPADLHVRQSDPPRFPSDPTAPSARCLLRVVVGTTGVPEMLDTRACPTSYAALAEQAVRQWRWDPPHTPRGDPARATVLVPITFTPQGRAAVEAAERCTYAFDVAASGALRVTGQSAPQCVVWAPETTPEPPPAVGACGVAIHADIARETEHWLDLSACPRGGQAFAANTLATLLFSTGTVSTRVMLALPDPTTAPPSLALDVDGSRAVDGPTRLGYDTNDAPADLDPPMIMTETELPEVDLSKLFGPGRLPPELDEESAEEPDED